MATAKMHVDEPDIDEGLVARLLAGQFPQWAGLPITRTTGWGTDNAMFRLGADSADLAVRLPRRPGGDAGLESEHRWLRWLRPRLPLAIPEPVALGAATAEYPYRWSVQRWLRGEAARLATDGPGEAHGPGRPGELRKSGEPGEPESGEPESGAPKPGEPKPGDSIGIRDSRQAARDLAGFLTTLQSLDPAGGPRPGPAGFGRGVPLATRDTAFRTALAELAALDDEFDPAALLAVWERALAAPEYDGPGVWVHGDLAGGNMLMADGRLTAVIDFGALAVADPAVDLLPAWTFFDAAGRAEFRAASAADDAAWQRGRGWGVSTAVLALPYYLRTYPGIVAQSRYQLRELLSET